MLMENMEGGQDADGGQEQDGQSQQLMEEVGPYIYGAAAPLLLLFCRGHCSALPLAQGRRLLRMLLASHFLARPVAARCCLHFPSPGWREEEASKQSRLRRGWGLPSFLSVGVGSLLNMAFALCGVVPAFLPLQHQFLAGAALALSLRGGRQYPVRATGALIQLGGVGLGRARSWKPGAASMHPTASHAP